MKKISSKSVKSLNEALSDVFGYEPGSYKASYSSIRQCIVVRTCDGIFTSSFCRVLQSWCDDNHFSFCFAPSPDNSCVCYVFI